MVWIETVARLNALIEPFFGVAPFVRYHPALPGTRGTARHRCTTSQRCLCFIRQCAETHAGNVNRNIQLDRTLCPWPNHGFSQALFPVTLDHESGQRTGKECQIIPTWNFLEQRKSPHTIPAELRLDVDIVNHLRRKYKTVPDNICISIG